ncbi:hypothetical protein PICMEDRAFT_32171 [Pichia membranifaciens NRRL Y-2026]|uniref:B-related factor 1 n=1 Tax=Pichia membranifaciens NRRL Y-2026 TaxID=763406 RepID=A0A1E3NMI2_9ASCO|nr:hypothetical protein PICMEDRAFT_32171 [Pichia membranifaciens NRRL Y-2026]ODQ47342.1 hypothetical protein PICMEDRAFT_32171 [Pichia membranifaciens NRRL Y-2026]
MSTGLVCRNCGGRKFSREYHTASGDLSCMECGVVAEENPIVSEVTFAENAAGAATVQGSYVSNDQSHANFGNGRGSMESREQTIQNGKKRIKNVALSLGIPDHISEEAHQWFKLALNANFVQGRRSQNVIAACLYTACRRSGTRHMLIDFSTRLQVSVYAVGATFLKMVKALHITEIPPVDPSIFIQHFADKLDFGKRTGKVIREATKIAKRMSDDWIRQGRRPAGVAGAAILLAARMNNFRRTHLEIVAVTHVGAQTIQKRLTEFKKTQVSKLTIDDFRDDKKEGTVVNRMLPPSFDKSRKELRKRKQEIEDVESVEDEMMNDPVLGAMLEDSEITEEEIQYHIKRVLGRKKKDLDRKISSKLVYKDGTTQLEADDENTELLRMIELNRPRNLSLALPTTEDMLNRIPDDDEDERFKELINDDELDSFILSKEESELKERLWTGSNQDFLIEQEKKRLKMETDKIAGHTTQVRKRRRRNADLEAQDAADQAGDKNGLSGLAGLIRANLSGTSSASDNAKALLNSKTLSKKINYNAVNNLFDDA